MRNVTIGGIKVQPKWEWSKEYKKHVQEHARDLHDTIHFTYMSGYPQTCKIIAEHDKARSGKGFRCDWMNELASSMVKYALWIVQRDGLELAWYEPVVNLTKGTVRFTVHPDLEGYTVHIPNHDWTPTIIEESTPDLLAA
jgi:hypothetical protein